MELDDLLDLLSQAQQEHHDDEHDQEYAGPAQMQFQQVSEKQKENRDCRDHEQRRCQSIGREDGVVRFPVNIAAQFVHKGHIRLEPQMRFIQYRA